MIISILFISLIVSGLFSLKNRGRASGEVAVIRVDGEIYSTLDLFEDGEFEVNTSYGTNMVTVKDGSVFISESDCRGNDCIREGAVSSTGEILVCLPHKLTITIEGGSTDVDTVTY